MPPPLAEILKYRQAQAYRRMFDLNGPDGMGREVERVLADLAEFSHANKSTANGTPEDMPVLEGRRQVYLRILQYLHFDETTLRRLKTVHDQYFNRSDDDEYD